MLAPLSETAAGSRAKHCCVPLLAASLWREDTPLQPRPFLIFALCRQIPCARFGQAFVESQHAKQCRGDRRCAQEHTVYDGTTHWEEHYFQYTVMSLEYGVKGIKLRCPAIKASCGFAPTACGADSGLCLVTSLFCVMLLLQMSQPQVSTYALPHAISKTQSQPLTHTH